MTGMFNELRIAMRSLARAPGFTAVAVLTLALGVGATTAVFTLVDSVLLRPLPYPESDRILSVQHEAQAGETQGGEMQLQISHGLYLLYAEHARSLSAIALHTNSVMNFTGEGEAERVTGRAVTASLHDVLGVTPSMGRPLIPADAEPGAHPVVLLSHGLWQSRFGGDPEAVGRTVVMNGASREIVGVMPRGFAFPDDEARFWVPLTVNPGASLVAFVAQGIARMAPGATPERVHGELEGIIARMGELLPEAGGVVGLMHEAQLTPRISALKEAVVGDLTRTLWTLLGLVAIVLLIACANIANLLLVRAEARQRELAVRQALGAGRWALGRPFLAESLVLALAGGIMGVVIAALAVRMTIALAPENLPRMGEVAMDLRVLAFAAAVSLVAALGSGMLPLRRHGREDLSNALREGGARGGTAGRKRHRIRNGLVVSQVVLALVLLVGSGLMFRSFVALMAVDPGFDREGILAVQVSVPPAEVAESRAVEELFRQLRERLGSQPGVVSVSAASGVPLGGQLPFISHGLEDFPTGPDELPNMAHLTYVDPGYFETLGIPVVDGRTLGDGDAADAFRGVVVSRAYAERWWPGASALGRRLSVLGGDTWEIVGVVENVRHRGLQEDPEEILYVPTMTGAAAEPQVARTRELLVRVAGEPIAFLPMLRREVRELNTQLPVSNPRSVEDVARASAAATSFTMAILGAASMVALILGLVGIYGVVSYVVSQRTREIGVRMALGASGASVRRMVARQGVGLAGIGVGAGLVIAFWASRLMDSLLFGVSSRDPATYGLVAVTLLAVAALASWLPARRAAGVDPAMALRQE
jgi:putative ABC transport system permease protein